MNTNTEANSMTLEAALKRIQELEAGAKASGSGSIKVSSKGAVSVYGLQRFPVTLYRSQWEALIKRVPEIQAFIETNRASLTEKPEKN